MKKKRVCSLFCIIMVAGLIATTGIILTLNGREIIRDVEVRNPDGSEGTVFVVFRPGVTIFNEEVVNEFIRGLTDSDWRVEVTTASSQTPTNVTAYDLIVLGSTTNGGKPHEAMLAYLARADLEGKPVILILTSGGTGEPSIDYFRNATIDANGVVHSEFRFQIFESDARSRAYTAGTEVVL